MNRGINVYGGGGGAKSNNDKEQFMVVGTCLNGGQEKFSGEFIIMDDGMPPPHPPEPKP